MRKKTSVFKPTKKTRKFQTYWHTSELNEILFKTKSDCWVINAPSQQSTCIGLSISLTASHKHIHIINKEYCSNLVCGFTSSLAILFQHLGLQILVVFDA